MFYRKHWTFQPLGLTCEAYPADNDCTVKTSSQSHAMAAVGVLALATMVSLTVLGTSAGVGTVVLTSSSQRVMFAGHEEEAAQWIASLAQAVKAMRGGPVLPEHFSAAITIPSSTLQSPRRVALAYRIWQASLPLVQPLLDCHLIDLPPPQAA